LSSLARGSSSSKTSAACSQRGLMKSLARNEYSETFQSLVSRLREDCSRRQKSARAISGSAYSSLGWLTPSANEYAAGTVEGKMQRMLSHQAKETSDQWSTPRASDGEKGGPNQSFGAGGMPLPAQTVQWMTPRSHEVGEYQYSRGDKTKPVLTLTGQSQQWATPSVADVQGGRMSRSKDRSDELLLNGQSDRLSSSLQDRIIYPVGQVSSHPRRSLNPLFVEWLMGWPPGWTLVAWTDFACSETELFHFKQRMRSALLQLGLPREAPPAQLALFG
jgi:hypothetical protein